jgi:2-amino-4-hydroxy-6-hydroxymethyldihydropteridine diphosphokinase
MRSFVVLGLGSNRGNSREILSDAIHDLRGVLSGLKASSSYKTKPQDNTFQDDFLNLVVTGYFTGTPRELLAETARIETKYGRNRENENVKGPRTLDIDIELFGNISIHEPDLIIPHERLRYRQFVLVPLLELLPDYADPVTGELYRDVCARLPDQGVIKAGIHYGN